MKKGDVVDGRYRIIKSIGKGGMSEVYLAENINTGSHWAIKKISKNNFKNNDFKSEFNIMKTLIHPALPRVFDIYENDTDFFMIEDFIEGKTLDNILIEDGHLSMEQILQIAETLAHVLIYLHTRRPEPVIYRDLKPSNIMIAKDGGIKLIDFGIARNYKSAASDDTVYIGTRGYAAPEQFGNGQSDERTDIYNLGMTLQHLITGRNPNENGYTRGPITTCNSEFPSKLEQIIEKCLNEDPLDRFQTAEGFLAELNEIKYESCDKKKFPEFAFQTERHDAWPKHKKRKSVITCAGNSEFTAELAYVLAKFTSLQVLIINLDFIDQQIDIYLDLVNDIEKRLNSGNHDEKASGVLGLSKKEAFLTSDAINEASLTAKGCTNLKVLVDDYRSNSTDLKCPPKVDEIFKISLKIFDIIIFHIGALSKDETIVSLQNSDCMIYADGADVVSVRKFCERISPFFEKIKSSRENLFFVGYEFRHGLNLSERNLKKLAGKKNYAGKINYRDSRAKTRNTGALYVLKYYEEIKNDYLKLTERMGIIML